VPRFELGRDSIKRKPIFWELIEITEVLYDQDTGSKQGRMHWPGFATRIIDVQRVDPYQQSAFFL
jgi:hypothetical protein